MQEPKSSPRQKGQPRIRRSLLPYLILLLGLAFTFIVSYYFSKLAEAQDESRFGKSVQEIDDRIDKSVQTATALLRAGTGLFAASESVEPQEFADFIERIELPTHYPGILGIGFSKRLRPEEKPALIATMQKSGVADFKIWPDDSPRAEYHTIIYLEPNSSINKLAIGYDMFTEPVRRAAMEQARDTGLPTASGRVELVQERDLPPKQKQPGFLIYVPVYRNKARVSNVAERRKSLVGFVYSPFRLGDFLRPILDKNYDVDFTIYDGSEPKPEQWLYSSTPANLSNRQPNAQFTTNKSHRLGERYWTIAYASKPSFEIGSSRAFLPYTFAAGVLLSLLFFAVTLAEVGARAAAERYASEVRDSEATIRKTLAERELAEQAMRESEERYRELVENATDIVYTLDFDGRITSINEAAELITEYSQEELLRMNIADILTVESLPAGQQMLESKSDREPTSYEVEIVSKSGRLLTLEISSRLTYKGGEPVGIQGIARDISTRRRAEEALREADQRALSAYERLLARISSLAEALGTARDLPAIFHGLRDFTNVSVPCNGFFVSLYDPIKNVRTACYGWGDGKELDISSLPAMPVTTSGPNSRAVRTGQVVITEDYMQATEGLPVIIVGPDNGLRPKSSMALPMAVMGRIIGTIEIQSYEASAYQQEHVTAMSMAANLTAVAIENIRLLKRESTAREAAEDSNRLKDEFLATVSHELRTPLTAILGWSRLLESGSLEDPVAQQAIETIWRNAKAQAQIVDDILDVSRIITGNLYIDLHPIELAPVVENAINVVRPTADAKGIDIDTTLTSTPIVVSGDANRLQQVIWNLLSNAVKFTASGGRVNLNLSQSDGIVEIKVSDTGQGISKDFLPFVFDRFRQADSTTTRQHGGLGLGLAIARHLVEIHGGSIRAESRGEGSGSTFIIKLPTLDSSSRAAVLAKSAVDQLSSRPRELLSGLHVLLVDDDPDTLELVTTALSRRQATVTAVASASEAIEAIKANRPDVLISDIAMPGEDGYDLIGSVRSLAAEQLNSIPAVAITAYAKAEDRERALAAGFQIYLAKPVELNELISVVARAARREFDNGTKAGNDETPC
jgi:PAS domain S-box-containing protein